MSLFSRLADISTLLFFCFAIHAHGAHAVGVQFVTPASGATWPAGLITVRWKDAGGSPDMSDLVSYTLELIVGGNSADNTEVLQTLGSPNASVASAKVEDTIPADIAQSVENGFYLKMTSNTTTGNQVINYSNRFTLINLNGSTDSKYLSGANAAGSVSNVPEAQYNIISPQLSTSASVSATTTAQPDASSTNSVTATATSAPTSTSTNSPQATVSTGLVAGLSLGLLVAAIIIVGIAIWALVRWRKKRRQQKQPPKPKAATSDTVFLGDKAELAADVSTTNLRSPVELSPTETRYEVDGYDKAVEADGATEVVYELEGDWSGWEAASGRRSQLTQAYDPTR